MSLFFIIDSAVMLLDIDFFILLQFGVYWAS